MSSAAKRDNKNKRVTYSSSSSESQQSLDPFQETQERLLKPMTDNQFQGLLNKNTQIIKKNQRKTKFYSPQRFGRRFQSSEKFQNQSTDVLTMNDLTNLKKQTKGEKYLRCEIDPKSVLYEPIETLRKLILRESDSEGELSNEDEDNEVNKSQKKERLKLDMYMTAVEQEFRKKINQHFSMDLMKDIHHFYQNSFQQFVSDLGSINKELKRIGIRLFNGYDLLFQSYIQHHIKEVQEYQNQINKLTKEKSYITNQYKFLQNDIAMINKLLPPVAQIIDYNIKIDEPEEQTFETEAQKAKQKNPTKTQKEQYMDSIIENEMKLNAINQIENLIEMRKVHDLDKKTKESLSTEYSIDKLQASNAEQSLKNILSEIKLSQHKIDLEARATLAIEKDEDDMDYQIQKQQKIINQDWIGERNTRIKVVERKLINRMADKLKKPRHKVAVTMTDGRYIEPQEYDAVVDLNKEYHKQLANNGVVFAMKEKQIESLKAEHTIAHVHWKRLEKQVEEIRELNRVKKMFLSEIRKEYDDIVMGILNLSLKFAREVKTQNDGIKHLSDGNDNLVEVLETQKKLINEYMYSLGQSHRFVKDYKKSHYRIRQSILTKNETPQINTTLKDTEKVEKRSSSSDTTSSKESVETVSSNDSVQQVLNSKMEFKKADIKLFEVSKLKQRFSIGPQILKKQIIKLNEQLLESQMVFQRSSQLSQEKLVVIRQRRKTVAVPNLQFGSGKSSVDASSNELSTFILNLDELQDVKKTVAAVEKKTYKGNSDDMAAVKLKDTLKLETDFVKQETEEDKRRKAKIAAEKEALAKEAAKIFKQKGLNEEEEKAILNASRKFDDFLKTTQSTQKKSNILSKLGQDTLQAIAEVDEEKKSEDNNSSKGKYGRKSKYVKTEVATTQTDHMVDDNNYKLMATIAYMSTIMESQMEFKTEVQNISNATKMMSESKIDQIRQIFKVLVNKAQSDSITKKSDNPIQAAIMAKIQKAILERQKSSKGTRNLSQEQQKKQERQKSREESSRNAQVQQQPSNITKSNTTILNVLNTSMDNASHSDQQANSTTNTQQQQYQSLHNNQQVNITKQNTLQPPSLGQQKTLPIQKSANQNLKQQIMSKFSGDVQKQILQAKSALLGQQKLNQSQSTAQISSQQYIPQHQQQIPILNHQSTLPVLGQNFNNNNSNKKDQSTILTQSTQFQQVPPLNKNLSEINKTIESMESQRENNNSTPMKYLKQDSMLSEYSEIIKEQQQMIQQQLQQQQKQIQSLPSAQLQKTENQYKLYQLQQLLDSMKKPFISKEDWSQFKEQVTDFQESEIQPLRKNSLLMKQLTSGKNLEQWRSSYKVQQFDNSEDMSQFKRSILTNGQSSTDIYDDTNNTFQKIETQKLGKQLSTDYDQEISEANDEESKSSEENGESQKEVLITEVDTQQQNQQPKKSIYYYKEDSDGEIQQQVDVELLGQLKEAHLEQSSNQAFQKFFMLNQYNKQNEKQLLSSGGKLAPLKKYPGKKKRKTKEGALMPLQPIQTVKLDTEIITRKLSESKSVPKLPPIRIIQNNNNQTININLFHDEPLEPTYTERKLDKTEFMTEKELEDIRKQIIIQYSEQKKNREQKEAIKYRDRKRSIEDLEKQNILPDTMSYSKQGKRLDYQTFNVK